MFDLGWSELLVIGIVALIVVGPKDLPGMFRTVGNFVGKAKRMVSDIKSEIDQELAAEELKKTIRTAVREGIEDALIPCSFAASCASSRISPSVSSIMVS